MSKDQHSLIDQAHQFDKQRFRTDPAYKQGVLDGIVFITSLRMLHVEQRLKSEIEDELPSFKIEE